MECNKVYFIGAGPGHPELLTVRGATLLDRCRTVFVPTPYEQSFADMLNDKNVMVPFDYRFEALLRLVEELLETENVAFLIPGDLTFYSPFQPFIDALGEFAEVVPGVGTANAASAILGKTLDLPDVSSRTIIVSPRTLGDDGSVSIRSLAAPGVTLLIYMNNIPLPQLVSDLQSGYNDNVPIAILHRLFLPGQEVVSGRLDDIVDKVGLRDFFNLDSADKRPALTLIVVGETLAAKADGVWWNHRHETIWQRRGTTGGSE